MSEVNDGTRQAQGWARQEGQAQEVGATPIYAELAFGRHILTGAFPAVTESKTQEEKPVCQVCKRAEDDHPFEHRFTPVGASVDTRQFDRRRSQTPTRGESPAQGILPPQRTTEASKMRLAPTPFDPVLRQALLDAGVITVEQLEQAQRKIALFTEQVTGGNHRGGE